MILFLASLLLIGTWGSPVGSRNEDPGSPVQTLALGDLEDPDDAIPDASEGVRDRQEIVKGSWDKRQYRAVTLSNNLRCALVYDNETEKAAIQLRVSAGYMAEETEGLAHFVEHMIFEGSESYPEPGSYADYISSKAGYYNGMTWESTTSYPIYISNEYLVPASRLLADAIGAPLLAKERLGTAIQAVESEYRNGLKSNYRSVGTIFLTLSNPASSYHPPFHVGSISTLNVSDIHQQVLDFHADQYSANIMNLVIVANETLDRLEEITEEIFGKIPNREVEITRSEEMPYPTRDRQYVGRRVYWKMKDESSNIRLLFPLPVGDYPNMDYLMYLLNHDAEGSLDRYLLNEGLVTSFGASYTNLEDISFVPLIMHCSVTPEGLADPVAIVDAVFKYMKSACKEGVSEDIWRQNIDIETFKYKFADKSHPFTLNQKIHDSMFRGLPPAEYLNLPWRRTFNEELENLILSYITPDNFNIFIGSGTFSAESETDGAPKLTKIEPWYNTPYLDEEITLEEIASWETTPTHPDLHLPTHNPYLPTNFDLQPVDTQAEDLPVKLDNDLGIEIWWHQNKIFRTPKVDIKCRLMAPATTEYTAELSMIRLFTSRTVGLAAKSYNQMTSQAGITSDIILGTHDWVVGVSGFSDPDKVSSVLQDAFRLFQDIDFNQEDGYFNATVRKPIRDYMDESALGAKSAASANMRRLLYTNYIENDDKLEALEHIKQEDLSAWILSFLSDVSMQCTAIGNIQKQEALDMVRGIKEKLEEFGATIVDEDRSWADFLPLVKTPPGATLVMRGRTPNPEELNSAVIVQFMMENSDSTGPDLSKPKYTVGALGAILEITLSQGCFNYLRTDKELGYSAGCSFVEYEGHQSAFRISVQGSREDAGADVMLQEIDNLVELQHEIIKTLTSTEEGKEELEQAKQTLIDQLSEKADSFGDYLSNLKGEIYARDTDFNRTEKYVAALQAVEQEDVARFFKTNFILPEKRKLVSQIYRASHDLPEGQLAEGEILVDLTDVRRFRESLGI